MKILHISKFYPPYRGGIEDVCYNIVNELKQKHEQKVICFNDLSEDDYSIWEGIEVIRAGLKFDIARQPLSTSLFSIIRKIINNFSPDVIHLHLPNPLASLYVLYLIPCQTKLILHWHSDIVAQSKIYYFYKYFERKILKRANKIIVTSPPYLDYSKPLLKFKEKSLIIPNIISLNKMNLSEDDILKVEEIKTLYKTPIIFFIGRHVPYKGIEYLIKAEKYIKEKCTIIIAGQGPLTEQLRKNNNSERIKLIGKITDDEVRLYMSACTIFAFPSITKNEAFGVALAEAMYCKAIPVTFTIEGSGVNWVNLHNITGLEVPNCNCELYAKAIDTILSNKNLIQIYSQNAHNRVVSNFTNNSIRNVLNKLYDTI